MKKLILSNLLLVLMSFWFVSVATALETNPENIIASSSKKLLVVLNQEQGSFKSNPQRLYSRVTNLMRPISDFPAISKGVMGTFYKTASAEQKKRFTTVFEHSLVRIFSNSLMKSKTNAIKLIPAKGVNPASPKRKVSVIVSTVNGDAFRVNYSMVRNSQNRWLIRNVILDGINLGLTYRNQFKSEMNRSGNNLNHVIANWGKIAKK